MSFKVCWLDDWPEHLQNSSYCGVLPVCSAQYLTKMVQETVVNQQQGHGQPWFNDEREKRTLARVVWSKREATAAQIALKA